MFRFLHLLPLGALAPGAQGIAFRGPLHAHRSSPLACVQRAHAPEPTGRSPRFAVLAGRRRGDPYNGSANRPNFWRKRW